MKEGWDKSDESMNIPPLECHKTDLSLAGPKEVNHRASTPIVLCQPLFTNQGTETGTQAGRETCEPKAVDCDRETSGIVGDGWVRHIC